MYPARRVRPMVDESLEARYYDPHFIAEQHRRYNEIGREVGWMVDQTPRDSKYW